MFERMPGIEILAVLYISAFFTQLMYHLFVFLPLLWYREDIDESIENPLSVIICAHNEQDVIEDCLRAVLSQNYPVFEVIAVDDGSTDNTLSILHRVASNSQVLRVIHVEIS